MRKALLFAAAVLSAAPAAAQNAPASPKRYECTETLIDAPGGVKLIRFELAVNAAGQSVLQNVEEGAEQFGRVPMPPVWGYARACGTTNSASVDAKGLREATCEGLMTDVKAKATYTAPTRLYVQRDYSTGVLLAKLVEPSLGQRIMNVLVCAAK